MDLDQKHLRAARLLAEGWHTLQTIAKKIGVTRYTLINWQKDPTFAAKVNEYRKAYHERIRSEGIANVENRVRAAGQRWRSMMALFNAVRKDPDKFDASLLKELREHEMQVARELGQLDKASDADQQAERVVRVRPVKKKPNAPDA